MPFQDADSEYTVLLLMALVALVVFVLMLIAAAAAIRSERGRKTPHPDKDETELPRLAAEDTAPHPAEAAAGARPQDESAASSSPAELATLAPAKRRIEKGVPGLRAILDRLPVRLQTVNWLICLLIATYLAWSNYSRLGSDLKMTSLYSDFVFLAVFSPSCLGIVWLRLTGIPWRQALLLLICVPAAVGVVQAVLGILAIFSHLLGYS